MLVELNSALSGGHVGVNRTLDKVRQRYYWLQARNNVEKWCPHCVTCAASRGPGTSGQDLMQQHQGFVREDIHRHSPSLRATKGTDIS
jgi:hypothetical protein